MNRTRITGPAAGAVALLALLLSVLVAPPATRAAHALGDARLDQGAAALGQAIRRLDVITSVLHTGAHPDDEDSALLAYLARGRQARTAYLSLTRGDGGQNIIGPELYDLLGVIRTEELLAARRLDGARQFFSRAYDFGFSKSREETLAKWDREAVLSDIVRVIRTFRPLVIVSGWTGTPRDGHGHHQAAGYLTIEAYHAAADPSRFPDQIAAGLRPWKARKLYTRYISPRQAAGEPPTEPFLAINTGAYDALLGRSYFEIAMQGRSMHRSQDQGALERRGPQYSRLRLLEGDRPAHPAETDIFDGLNPSLTGIADFAPAGAGLTERLAEVRELANEAARRFNPFSPAGIVAPIAEGLSRLRAIRDGLPSREGGWYEVDFLLKEKIADFERALALAQGIQADCLASDEIVTPGQTFDLSVTAFASDQAAVERVRLDLPRGWTASEGKTTNQVVEGRLTYQAEFKVKVAEDAQPTAPYWLANPRRGEMFVPAGGVGIEPYAPPPVVASLDMRAGGQSFTIQRAAQFRYADKALGEIRRELKVAPAISVTVAPQLLIVPASREAVRREVTVALLGNAQNGLSGKVRLNLPQGWRVEPADAPFELAREGERASFMFTVEAPPNAAEGRHEVRAEVYALNRRFESGYQMVAYPHIEPRAVYRKAEADARVFDVKLAQGLRIGYIEGAGDEFDEALVRLGADVRVIGAAELARGDLSGYDAIVTGVRVYEVRPDVVANNRRLLDYVKNGGTLIVQYNKNEYAGLNLAPYPIKMERTPDRVTDETAPVTILKPDHPLFNFPNRITAKDFEGWIQERGAYFLREWDSAFVPLLASNDAGQEPQRGGELIASYGKGLYVYTAYAWFRQLPAGVPGAYRLIANLVSLPKAPR